MSLTSVVETILQGTGVLPIAAMGPAAVALAGEFGSPLMLNETTAPLAASSMSRSFICCKIWSKDAAYKPGQPLASLARTSRSQT